MRLWLGRFRLVGALAVPVLALSVSLGLVWLRGAPEGPALERLELDPGIYGEQVYAIPATAPPAPPSCWSPPCSDIRVGVLEGFGEDELEMCAHCIEDRIGCAGSP